MRQIIIIIIKVWKRLLSVVKLCGWKIAYGVGFHCGKFSFFYPGCHVLVECTGKLQIGSHCFFNHSCSITCLNSIMIGNDCIFGENVRLYDHNHQFQVDNGLFRQQPYTLGKIVIGNNCWIGSNVVILANVTIGNNVVIGAGTVVTKSIPDNTVIYNRLQVVLRELS